MILADRVIELIQQHPEWLPFEFSVSWRGTPDEGFQTTCWCCCHQILVGDMCVVKYFEHSSITFCYGCYEENTAQMDSWLVAR